MRVATFVTHPIQYYAPLFRELSNHVDVHVFYGQIADAQQQSSAGFGVGFEWDVDLMGGYTSTVLQNVSKRPSVDTFSGCDVPDIGKMLSAGGFDAVIVLGWYQKFFIQTILAAKSQGIPVLVRGDSQLDTPRTVPKRLAKSVVYSAFLRLFDGALYVGEKSRSYYEHYHYPQKRLFFSPHCVDAPFFKARSGDEVRKQMREELRVSPETGLVLFAGKLIDLKRPLDTVRAISRVRKYRPQTELIIAGAGPLERDVRREADRLDVPLHILGFCNQSKMPSVYAAADVLCLPSQHETWGLVCNEALACGTPVIVSDQVGCAPDLAADGCVGQTFKVGDCVELEQALVRVLNNPPTPEKVAALSQRYSIANAVEGIMSALEASAGKDVSPAR